jgi:hypothetical protein
VYAAPSVEASAGDDEEDDDVPHESVAMIAASVASAPNLTDSV